MAPVGALWGALHQPQTRIILSVAALNELELERPELQFPNKPVEFTAKFPYGKIPTFEGSDGFKLIEGASIARYLSGLGTKINLLGSNAHEIAAVDQWVHFSEQEVGEPTHHMIHMIFGATRKFMKEAYDDDAEQIARGLEYLELHLATCPTGYLVGDSVTLADIFLAGMVWGCSQIALGTAERAQYPSVFAHYARVTGDERLKQFWGTEQFADVPIDGPRPYPMPSVLHKVGSV